MRLESVEIYNYRQYRNVKFEFSAKNEHDIHIILGNNGMGKTNLLNAISWCLYGKESHLSIENRAKKKVNTLALQEAIQQGKDKCMVKVCVKISVDSKQINFERSQEFKATKEPFEYKPSFVVTLISPNGNQVLTDIEEIGNMIKQYLPEEISEYFFFDGEQLDKYFISNQGEKIHQAIYNISQVNLLDSMNDRLGKVIHGFQREAGGKNTGINELNAKKEQAEELVNNLRTSIKNCKEQSSLAESEITICNEYLSGKDGIPDKEKEYQDLSIQLQEKEHEWEAYIVEFEQFLREYKILFSLYPKLKKTLDIINNKENQGQLPPNIDKQFLERMLKYHKCYICDRDMEEEEEKKVEQLLNQLNLSSAVSNLLVKIKNPIEESIEKCKLYPKKKEELQDHERRLRKEIQTIREKFNRLDAFLKDYQDKDRIREMHERRSRFSEIKKQNDEDKIRFEIQLDNAQKELQKIEADLKRAIENQEELKVLEKQISFAEKARCTVQSIEEEMMAEAKEKMTKETMDIFQELDWKTETFSHIVLDDSYALELYDNYGYPMVGACSAAERALLALSFTLALQKVSGYDSMLFIDTPVGRVDLENRASFATVLKQLSQNKQVIITFTPSEYSQEIKDTLEPYASTFKKLETTDESEIHIREV